MRGATFSYGTTHRWNCADCGQTSYCTFATAEEADHYLGLHRATSCTPSSPGSAIPPVGAGSPAAASASTPAADSRAGDRTLPAEGAVASFSPCRSTTAPTGRVAPRVNGSDTRHGSFQQDATEPGANRAPVA